MWEFFLNSDKNSDRILMWKVRMVRSVADRTFQPWLARAQRSGGPRAQIADALQELEIRFHINILVVGGLLPETRVERFDRRPIEPFELFTSEVGQNSCQNSGKILTFLQKILKFEDFSTFSRMFSEIPRKSHQNLTKIRWKLSKNYDFFLQKFFSFLQKF